MHYKAHLIIIELIVRCSLLLQDGNLCRNEQAQAEILAGKMLSSIPYLLLKDPQGALSNPRIQEPGRPFGGLLLMFPLYAVTMLSVIPPAMKTHMRKCLAWIGKNMNIGQARLLSMVSVADM